MALLIVLLALGLVQLWGSGAPLHNDGWFVRWSALIARRKPLDGKRGLVFGVTILLPVLLVAVIMVLAESILGGFGLLLLGVPVLLYCFGRGNFHEILSNYLRAWYRGDLVAAKEAVTPLLQEAPTDSNNPQDLHQQVFRAAAYCAFERLFAVIFWFLVLGIPGALLYRLSQLYVSEIAGGEESELQADKQLSTHWLWLLEWLPVRVMGFTFAVVGNFAGCYRVWRQCLMCRETSTEGVLETYLEGALGGIDSGECSAGATVNEGQRVCGTELEALQGLLSRALLMWLTVLALYVLFGN